MAECDPYFVDPRKASLAAALRATADHVVPLNGSRKNNEIRFELLAIAAELDYNPQPL
jgi:hypothetical protein